MAGEAPLYAGSHTDLAELCGVLSALAPGFLFWNWHPARAFIGDVASGLLVYTFAVFVISSDAASGPSMLVRALLLGVFRKEAKATFLRRIREGERSHGAHRSHAYRLATPMGYNHRQVAMIAV